MKPSQVDYLVSAILLIPFSILFTSAVLFVDGNGAYLFFVSVLFLAGSLQLRGRSKKLAREEAKLEKT